MTLLEGPILGFAMLGMTHYVDIGNADPAVIYYANASTAHMTLPDGPTLSGDLTLGPSGYFVDWIDGPEGDWQIARQGATLIYLNGYGEPSGEILRIVPGNAEGF
ncbi:MAG: hypothetical protein AAF245_09305 [Pseudomonadota bacterium]